MNRHLQVIGGIVFALIGFGFVFGAAYHWVMFGSQPTHDSLIETLGVLLDPRVRAVHARSGRA